MTPINNILNLPPEILAIVIDNTGSTALEPICKIWRFTFQNVLHLQLRTILQNSYSNFTETSSTTTTELMQNLFEKTIQLQGSILPACFWPCDYRPLHIQLLEIQKGNEQSAIDCYYKVIKKVDSSPDIDSELTAIKMGQLSLTEEKKALKEWLNILSLTTLTSLNLSQLIHANLFRALPPEIGNFTFLQTLILNNNALRVLPPEIGNLTDLQTLSLSGNSLRTLPPELSKLKKLTSLSIKENPITFLPSQLKFANKDYVFNLSADIAKIQELFQSIKWLHPNLRNTLYRFLPTYNSLPDRVLKLIDNYSFYLKMTEFPLVLDLDVPESLLEKLHALQALEEKFSSTNSLDALLDILNFSSRGLYEQQIVEVVIELFNNLEENHPLKLEINQAVATALGLNLENEPEAGLEKFLFRPLDPEIKQAVIALQSNDNSSSVAYDLLSKEREKNAKLLRENDQLTQENKPLKQEAAKVPTLEKAINRQALQIEQAEEYQKALEEDFKKEKEQLQTEISSLREQLLENEEKEIYQKRKDAFLVAGIKIFSQDALIKHLSASFNEQYWNHMKFIYKDVDFDAIEQEHPLPPKRN